MFKGFNEILLVLCFIHFTSDWAKILMEMSAIICLETECLTCQHSEEEYFTQVVSEFLSVLYVFIV